MLRPVEAPRHGLALQAETELRRDGVRVAPGRGVERADGPGSYEPVDLGLDRRRERLRAGFYGTTRDRSERGGRIGNTGLPFRCR